VVEQLRPAGVILFARNVEEPDQVRNLVAMLQDVDPQPFVAVDLEGGTVNRLSGIWGPLPSPAEAAVVGRRAVRALGEAAGAACRSLGIHLDLAPVIDLARPTGLIASQSRCLSESPERVVVLARVFAQGLAAWAVSGCLKHFPGLGAVAVDTHETLPVLDLDESEMELHLSAFSQLSEEIPVVMVGHAVAPFVGDRERPASLSAAAVELAATLPGSPVVLSDDLEMGALNGFGDLPDRVVAALRARTHGALVCSAFDRLGEIAERLRLETAHDHAFAAVADAMAARIDTLRRDLCQRSAAVPAPDDRSVAQLWQRARREAEA